MALESSHHLIVYVRIHQKGISGFPPQLAGRTSLNVAMAQTKDKIYRRPTESLPACVFHRVWSETTVKGPTANTLIWLAGNTMGWDVIIVNTLAHNDVSIIISASPGATENAAARKSSK